LLLSAGPRLALAQTKPDLAHARSLIVEGKGTQAWEILEPFEFDLAGDEDYDYLLGVAAIEAGHPERATLAFERVLAVNPNHAAARLDMGRAYYLLGDYDRAKIELMDLLAHAPPPAARTTIERYLAAISLRTQRGAPRVTGYVEASLGHDSNINAGVSKEALFLPLFGATFTLDPTATRLSDDFIALGAGAEAAFPVTERLSLLAGGDLRQRVNSSHEDFDHRSADLRAGVQHSDERDTVRFMAGTDRYELDDAAYRRVQNLNLEWRRQLDRRTQLSLYAADLRIRYLQPATRPQSSNVLLYGVGAIRTLDEAKRTFVFGSAFRGDDGATDGRIDGDRRLHGLRAGIQRELRGNVDGYATVGFQKSTYSQENPIFAELRRDRQYDLALGAVWRVDYAWVLRPQVGYTRNDSTTAINKYDRYELSVTLRREWR
jgi:tetratricopeptide (TPR) repeat protein